MDQLYKEFCTSQDVIETSRNDISKLISEKWVYVFQKCGKENLRNLFPIVSILKRFLHLCTTRSGVAECCKKQQEIQLANVAGIFNSFCRDAPASLSSTVLKSMKLSTVMKCVQGSQCSLHLSIKGTLTLDENIRGLEICSLSVDTQQSQCVNVRFSRKTSNKLGGRKVHVQFNCFEVNVAQHIYVTMKTIPNYCEVQLSQQYYVEAGKLDYNVDRARKTISVNVSDFLQDQDYYVRLCHKWFTCEDVGSFALIKRKESLKSTSLQYSQLLPCLCIEGWSAIPDARRTQLCPFKNDTKALWDNIVYNSATQTLAWKPACPVHVTVNLCRLTQSNDQCVDLQNASTTAPEKVKYSRVDTHPRLCMKFTTKQGSWVRCPFAHGNFPALSSESQEDDENSIRIMSLTAIILILVTMMALLGHKILTGT
ncbi:interleukin-17 receptor E-like protein [Eretmochelys imbricata]